MGTPLNLHGDAPAEDGSDHHTSRRRRRLFLDNDNDFNHNGTYTYTYNSNSYENTQPRRRAPPPNPPRLTRSAPPGPAPYIPPGGAYESVPRDPLYHHRRERLGIKDNLLRPAGTAALAARAKSSWGERVRGLVVKGAGEAAGLRRRQRGLGELKGGGWRPTRMGFERRWPGEEDGTEWFEMVYTLLYVRVGEFVREYFGYGDLAVGDGGVWVDVGGKEIRWFVEKVAKQDNYAGGWDALLVKKVHRECLVTGVIGKALETSVFEELLFGADEDQASMLEAQDRCTLDQDGYQRTELRSRCVRALLGDDLLTADFWPCVDERTLQLTTMLLPLVRVMDKNFPASRVKSLRSLYQDLHTIVALAGYLSIGIRWSGSIFRFSSPFPGQTWDIDQQHVDDTIYNGSVVACGKADKTAEEKWKAARKQLEREAATPQAVGHRSRVLLITTLNKINTTRRRYLDPSWKEEPNKEITATDTWHQPSRIAKVQIILWPMLQRFTAVGGIDPESGAAAGETIETVLKAQVVYYSGRVDGDGESEDHPTLEAWLKKETLIRQQEVFRPLVWVLYTTLLWTSLELLGQYNETLDTVLRIIKYGVIGSVQYAAWEAILLVIEAVITVIWVANSAAKILMFSTNLGWTTFEAIGTGIADGVRGIYHWQWHSPTFPDLNFNFGVVRNMAKGLLDDMVWREVTFHVPAGYGRP